jgi:hypothetical protein
LPHNNYCYGIMVDKGDILWLPMMN